MMVLYHPLNDCFLQGFAEAVQTGLDAVIQLHSAVTEANPTDEGWIYMILQLYGFPGHGGKLLDQCLLLPFLQGNGSHCRGTDDGMGFVIGSFKGSSASRQGVKSPFLT